MKILGRNVKVYRNDDVYSGLEYKNRIRNSFDDEGLTFITDGQVWETGYVEAEDRNWDPEGFNSKFIVRNASYILYKKYRNSGSSQTSKYWVCIKDGIKIDHSFAMKIEQSMLELINAG